MSHFQEDMSHAHALLEHAKSRRSGLKEDILRACWMMAVGACDAFFCDAYCDLVARALRAKDLEPDVQVPDRLGDLRVPAITVIRRAAGGWRWRMAARELVQKENVLSLEKIRELLNQFCQDGDKLISKSTIEDWILHRDAKSRCFAMTRSEYRTLATCQAKDKAKRAALKRFEERFSMIFQRRHDCIHNCDRPKVAYQSISYLRVEKVLRDIEFLVGRVSDVLCSQFPLYLLDLGFSGVTRNRVLVDRPGS